MSLRPGSPETRLPPSVSWACPLRIDVLKTPSGFQVEGSWWFPWFPLIPRPHRSLTLLPSLLHRQRRERGMRWIKDREQRHLRIQLHFGSVEPLPPRRRLLSPSLQGHSQSMDGRDDRTREETDGRRAGESAVVDPVSGRLLQQRYNLRGRKKSRLIVKTRRKVVKSRYKKSLVSVFGQ